MNYAFTHANLLNGKKNMKVQEDMTVLVEDDKIVSILSKGTVPTGFEEINVEGKYLMPGMINAHVHLAGNGDPVYLQEMAREVANIKDPVKLFSMINDVVKTSLVTSLNAGITTVRSAGDLGFLDMKNRDEINEGKYIGPRLLGCGIGVTVPGGHADGNFGSPCQTASDCQKVIEQDAAKNVDWIKLFITGGVADATVRGEPGILRMPYELAKASCDIAHEKGFKVAAHVESTEGVRVALKAGVDTIEHGALMDDEIIDLYKSTGSAVVSTIIPAITIARLPLEMTKMTEVNQYNSQVVMQGIIDSAKQALANDIPVGIGTDAACPYVTHYSLWREVCFFAKYCNVSNDYALHLVTEGNAKIIGVDQITGTVEEGKCADLIVVDQNPLDNLANLEKVSMVMARGHLISDPHYERIDYIDQELDKMM